MAEAERVRLLKLKQERLRKYVQQLCYVCNIDWPIFFSVIKRLKDLGWTDEMIHVSESSHSPLAKLKQVDREEELDDKGDWLFSEPWDDVSLTGIAQTGKRSALTLSNLWTPTRRLALNEKESPLTTAASTLSKECFDPLFPTQQKRKFSLTQSTFVACQKSKPF